MTKKRNCEDNFSITKNLYGYNLQNLYVQQISNIFLKKKDTTCNIIQVQSVVKLLYNYCRNKHSGFVLNIIKEIFNI